MANQNWLDLTTGDCQLYVGDVSSAFGAGLSRERIVADFSQKNISYVSERAGVIRLPEANAFGIGIGALLLFHGVMLDRIILSVSEDWDDSDDAVRRAEEHLRASCLPVKRRFRWGSVALDADTLSGCVTYTITYKLHSPPELPNVRR